MNAASDRIQNVMGKRLCLRRKLVMLLQNGCDILLSDYPSDEAAFADGVFPGQLVRHIISPILIEKGGYREPRKQIEQIKILAVRHPNVIIGTGLLSYNVPTENILMVKELCLSK